MPPWEPVKISAAAPSGPLWSVMIPCYNPKPDHLAAALRSVLQQDPGADLMQIEVIDDCSPQGAPAELVAQIAGHRVSVFRGERNLGLAGIWNRCLERAQGKWVHILHQDDLVLPGFYEKLKAGIDSPAAPGLVYCRHSFVDDAGRQLRLSNSDAEQPGCLPNALPHLASAQRVQTPAVIVRRAAYEMVGGFRPDLCFALDWEMWCRIAQKFPIWYEPQVLASYRIHSTTATSRLLLEGRDVADIRKCIALISGYVPDAKTRAEVRRQAERRHALFAVENARQMLGRGQLAASRHQLAGALQFDFSLPVLKQLLKLLPAAAGATLKKIFRSHA